MNISDLRARIVGAVEQTTQNLGLEPCGSGAFCAQAPGVVGLLTVSFLDRRHAAAFGTSSASFSLEVGVWFAGSDRPLMAEGSSIPQHFECDVRRLLVRDIRQKSPSEDLSPPDATRRDIWWVAKTGEDLRAVTESASRVVARQAPQFFSLFSNTKRAHGYFRYWWLTRYLRSAPFNIGKPGSPSHRDLLKRLSEHRQNRTVTD